MGRRAKDCNCGETPFMCKMFEEEARLEETEMTEAADEMNEDDKIYYHVSDAIEIERRGQRVPPIDLAALYREFKEKYFGDSVPNLSDDFICVFLKLPYDAAGICFLEEDAVKLGIRKGIRINENLSAFPAEAKVALLHEMIHASGVK